ncbi:conserved hypothetical protein [Bradyrhizobium sp. STM 3843]|nr:conserved hypothetical protein [Bradyrhizobium sp. STM 3843]
MSIRSGGREAMGVHEHSFVIAGLDPAIHQSMRMLNFGMDARAFAAPNGLRPRRRVKPAHDDLNKRSHS